VVDGFSTDNTLKILDEFNKKHGNVKLIVENSSRGKARERGIQEVETEWFAFVDSDVILCKDWFKKAVGHMQEDVGAVWGVDIPGNVRNRFIIKILQYMETRVFNIRGGCHDILIRRDAVKDIRIPSELHVLEDAYIKEWIATKNYRVVVSHGAYCKHYKTMNSLMSKENRLSTIFEMKNTRFMKERLAYATIYAILWLLQEAGSKD
jgi:glycosyltransferase involved in cell wall biosynthesis